LGAPFKPDEQDEFEYRTDGQRHQQQDIIETYARQRVWPHNEHNLYEESARHQECQNDK
jgi:hypothetical protein